MHKFHFEKDKERCDRDKDTSSLCEEEKLQELSKKKIWSHYLEKKINPSLDLPQPISCNSSVWEDPFNVRRLVQAGAENDFSILELWHRPYFFLHRLVLCWN